MSEEHTSSTPADDAPYQRPTSPPAERPGLSTTLLAFLLAWPVIVAGFVWWSVKQDAHREVEAALVSRPPVAVLDIEAIVKNRPASQSVEDGLHQSNALAQQMRDAGFLVLRTSGVISAPAAITVPAPATKEEAQ